MYQDYSTDACKQYLINAIDQLSVDPKFKCILAERMSADYENDKFVDAAGYDQLGSVPFTHEDPLLEVIFIIKKEVKFTCRIQKGTELRVSSLASKRNKCDYVKIIDGVNNRVSVIPHDEFFEVFDCTKTDEFRWCAQYGNRPHTNRKIRPLQTELFLKHEVTNVQ